MLLGDDFLLNTEWARKLYHCHAEKMPIIDYHCHLVPAEIYENKSYENLAQVWLYDNGFKVLPTFRPDGLMNISAAGFADYCDKLCEVSGTEVTDWESLKAAARQRLDYFHEVGGRLADHGMNSFVFCPATDEQVDEIVCRALNEEGCSASEAAAYQTALTLFLMGEYECRGWTLQLHMNCFRNDSSKNFEKLGVDAGFDTVGDQPDMVYQIKCLLDAAEQADGLPKCILYSLNDADWLGLASLAGTFQCSPAKPKIQFGNAWWFNDTFSGMKKQITTFAEQGLLGNITGAAPAPTSAPSRRRRSTPPRRSSTCSSTA